MTYDATDQLAGTQQGSTSATYARDPLQRLVTRAVTTNGSITTDFYAYTGRTDSPSLLLDQNGTVRQRMISLPGGVSLALAANSETWSYPNLHGDVIATADAAGSRPNLPVTYSPYGEGVGPTTSVANAADQGWVGSASRLTDHASGLRPIILMGARPYDPSLGRFLSVDPVEGGCANSYVYVYGDPLNSKDLNGQGFWGDAWNAVKCVATVVRRNLGTVASLGLGIAGLFTGVSEVALGLSLAGLALGAVSAVRSCQDGTDLDCGLALMSLIALGGGAITNASEGAESIYRTAYYLAGGAAAIGLTTDTVKTARASEDC